MPFELQRECDFGDQMKTSRAIHCSGNSEAKSIAVGSRVMGRFARGEQWK